MTGKKKQLKNKINSFTEYIRNESILQAAMDGFCVLSIDGRLMEGNQALCRMLGYTRKELIGKKLADIEVKETDDQVVSHIEYVIKNGCDRFETKHRRKDGRIIDVEVSTRCCSFEKDKFLVSFWRDVSEYKKAEAKIKTEIRSYREKVLLAQKRAYIGSIGTIVAHQLTGPLTMINMLLGKAMAEVKDVSCCPGVIKHVKDSLAEVRKASLIIQKFRSYCAQPALETRRKVNIRKVVDRIIAMLSMRAKEAGIAISTKSLDELPKIEINETALEQIFLNLIQNAIEAACNGRKCRLEISGKRMVGSVELKFADDCGGIAAEHTDKIFEPFFTTKNNERAMGLGLDIVKQILFNCGGKIRVKSRAGAGAVFYVTLPIGMEAP